MVENGGIGSRNRAVSHISANQTTAGEMQPARHRESVTPPPLRPNSSSTLKVAQCQSRLHPVTQRQVQTGNSIVDPSRLESIVSLATKCVLCRQTLIAKHADGYQLTFPKSHSLKGFAVTERDSRVKGQRKDQPLCLQCLGRHFGFVSESADRLGISIARVGRVGPAEVWFQRSSPAEPWRQLKTLLGEELKPLILREEQAKQAFGGRRGGTAAEAALNRGRKAGEIARGTAPPAVRVFSALTQPAEQSSMSGA